MATRKLSNDEIFEIIKSEFTNDNGIDYDILYTIKQAQRKIDAIESFPIKGHVLRFMDKHQSSFWIFMFVATVLLSAKLIIEAYLYKY